jgi:hypothetical protein
LKNESEFLRTSVILANAILVDTSSVFSTAGATVVATSMEFSAENEGF